MLSVKESYNLLNSNLEDISFSNEEAKLIRDFLIEMADITFNTFNQQKENITDEQVKSSGENSNPLYKS